MENTQNNQPENNSYQQVPNNLPIQENPPVYTAPQMPPQQPPTPPPMPPTPPEQYPRPVEKKSQHTLAIVIISLIILILIIVGIGYWIKNSTSLPVAPVAPTTSTMPINPQVATSTVGYPDDSVTADEQAAVVSYITANIDNLSPKKPVAGRHFTITDITVESPGRATVEYNDGGYYYTAAMSYTGSTAGNIVATSFTLLTK